MNEVTKQDRQVAKAVNFGLLYGMAAGGLKAYSKACYGVDMSLEEASLFRKKYFESYQGIRRWHQLVAQSARPGSYCVYETGVGTTR